MTPKLQFASLIPYRLREGVYEYFIQKRARDAKRSPGEFGLFGGKLEAGETHADAVIREISEELTFESSPVHFWSYEFAKSFLHVYTQEVEADFEKRIKVEEGEYGTFMTLEEMGRADKVNPMAELAVLEIDRMLAQT